MSGPANELGTAAYVLGWHAQQERARAGKQAGPPVEDTRDHTTEILTAHGGQPGISQQSATHGAGLPAVDTGLTEQQKYGAG